jgi:hypothetical protein
MQQRLTDMGSWLKINEMQFMARRAGIKPASIAKEATVYLYAEG